MPDITIKKCLTFCHNFSSDVQFHLSRFIVFLASSFSGNIADCFLFIITHLLMGAFSSG